VCDHLPGLLEYRVVPEVVLNAIDGVPGLGGRYQLPRFVHCGRHRFFTQYRFSSVN
jgi:hypothetical protein